MHDKSMLIIYWIECVNKRFQTTALKEKNFKGYNKNPLKICIHKVKFL